MAIVMISLDDVGLLPTREADSGQFIVVRAD